MAIQRITSAEFEEQIRTAILDRNAEIDTALGPVRDLIISPVSRVLEDQNERIRRLSLIMSLLNVGEFTETELNEYAFNEGAIRRTGTRSLTSVFFQTRVAPTVDIIVPVNFPVATPVDPTLSRSVIFRTTESRTLPAATAALFFNASSGFYELEVPVQAVASGEDGNVGQGRITQMQASIGFERVTNRVASSGGRDRETNEDLAERVLVAVPGTDISTKFGLEKSVLDRFSDVSDIEEVFGLDPLLLRAASNAGAVDAYIVGSTTEVVTETHTFLGVGQRHILDAQPVLSVASVDAGGPAFVQGVDYELDSDTGVNAGSVRGQDAIVFLAAGTPPTIGDTITVVYNRNSLIQDLQDDYTVPDRLVFGRDLLFKSGIQQDIEISFNLSVLSGSNATTIMAAVVSAIGTFINNLGLGDNVELSDVNAEVRKIAGVDNFSPTVFRIIGSGAGVADISIERNEYARIDSGNIIGTVV